MKLKKIIALSLTAVMLPASFIGCGGKESNETTQKEEGTDSQKEDSNEPVEVSIAIWGGRRRLERSGGSDL